MDTALELDLTWQGLTYTVQAEAEDGSKYPKILLNNISGTARRSRTLAVMGPSGAGKSTFLNGVSGRLLHDANNVIGGTAFLNDILFLSKYKPIMSFVAQDDIVMGKDTVREALYFSYRMRSGATVEEANERVEAILEKLHLTKCGDTLLGIPGMIKGVSGGEKKRTNIGSELINNPYVLMLDEPTTGLDSVNALRVGLLLRDLAHDDKRTVICTIHTPSSELFDTFDDLLLLAKGEVVYHGTREGAVAYFASIGQPVPHRTNPSEHYMRLLQGNLEELNYLTTSWTKHAASPAAADNLSINHVPTDIKVNGSAQLDAILNHRAVGAGTELALLTGRSWRTTMRDPAGTIGKFVQAIFFAVLLALFFANLTRDDAGVADRAGVLFMMTINLTFLHVMNAIVVFPPERAVFLQEQANGMYNAYLYYFSKMIAELPLNIVIPTIYTIIVYWSLGLANTAVAFFNHLSIVLMIAYIGSAFGMFAASLFPRPEIAFTITPLMLMPQMLVAGLFANTARLEPYWIWLNYIAFPRYAFKAFMVNEFDHVEPLCHGLPEPTNITALPAGTPICQYYTGAQALKVYGFDKTTDTVWFSIVIMAILMLVFRFMGATALYIQGRAAHAHLVFEDNYHSGKASAAAAQPMIEAK